MAAAGASRVGDDSCVGGGLVSAGGKDGVVRSTLFAVRPHAVRVRPVRRTHNRGKRDRVIVGLRPSTNHSHENAPDRVAPGNLSSYAWPGSGEGLDSTAGRGLTAGRFGQPYPVAGRGAPIGFRWHRVGRPLMAS